MKMTWSLAALSKYQINFDPIMFWRYSPLPSTLITRIRTGSTKRTGLIFNRGNLLCHTQNDNSRELTQSASLYQQKNIAKDGKREGNSKVSTSTSDWNLDSFGQTVSMSVSIFSRTFVIACILRSNWLELKFSRCWYNRMLSCGQEKDDTIKSALEQVKLISPQRLLSLHTLSPSFSVDCSAIFFSFN